MAGSAEEEVRSLGGILRPEGNDGKGAVDEVGV